MLQLGEAGCAEYIVRTALGGAEASQARPSAACMCVRDVHGGCEVGICKCKCK